MNDLTARQWDETVRILTECGLKLSEAERSHPQQTGYHNFELARATIKEALKVLRSTECPREVQLAAKHLRTARGALQLLNSGAAAPSISAAQEQIDRMVSQLEPVRRSRLAEFDADEG